jgi:hypothetical protein
MRLDKSAAALQTGVVAVGALGGAVGFAVGGFGGAGLGSSIAQKGAMAMALKVFGPEEMKIMQSEGQFLAEGGPGANVIAALGKEPGLVKKARDIAMKDISDEEFKDQIAALTGRKDLTEDDAKVARRYILESKQGVLKASAEEALQAESERSGISIKEGLRSAFAGVSFGEGLEKEVRAAEKGGLADVKKLIRATVERGDIEKIRKEGGIPGTEIARAVDAQKEIDKAHGASEYLAILEKHYGKENVGALMTDMGLSGAIDKTAATDLAARLATGGITSAAGLAAPEAAFRGGMENIPAEMSLAKQIRGNTEMIAALTSRIEKMSGPSFTTPSTPNPTSSLSSGRPP